MTHIAFIGLGAMGSGMAARLAASGHAVKAFDLNAEALERARHAGCQTVSFTAEAVEGASAVVTMLPSGADVRSVYVAPDGLLAHAAPKALLLDCSTISVNDARGLHQLAGAQGLDMCDAPVSGGVAAAQAGSLTFMVGGSDGAFCRATPILASMGKVVIRAGEAGAGQAAKICNNMLLAISMIGTCEAFALAERLGLDARAFFEIASQSSGQCWSMTSYAPVPDLVPSAPSNREFTNGFAASLMLKDLRLACDAANSVDAVTPMALRAEEIYSKYVSNYSPDRDFSGVIAMLSKEFMPL